MVSRVGGGGYAENRGGYGDRTGGGMSGNARDGLGGTGRGGDSNLAAERARLRAAGATTITPKYGWDQARLSDFGIMGGLSNMAQGIFAGNTYAGRSPQGLRAAAGRDAAERSMMENQRPTTRRPMQQMFQPNSVAAVQPPAAALQRMFMPGQTIGTGGKYGISQFRPGYNFISGGL